MGEATLTNMVLALIVIVFGITALIFMSKAVYTGTALTTPEELTSFEQDFSGVNSSVDSLASGIEGAEVNESSEGWVTSACTSLLGNDNFFCAGIKTLNSVKDAPQTFRLTIGLFKSSIPKVSIPAFVFTAITSMLVTVIVFLIIGALRRYRT
jgi:hypothetical protein